MSRRRAAGAGAPRAPARRPERRYHPDPLGFRVLGEFPHCSLYRVGPTWTAAYFVLRPEGTLGVLTSAESISAIGAALYGLVRVGRWWRDVKPPEPMARRAKE